MWNLTAEQVDSIKATLDWAQDWETQREIDLD
jgi:hypothetical protein